MNLYSLFRRGSAPVARERLQILLAHEREARGDKPDLLGILREEILAVISRHVAFDPDKVEIKLERGKLVSTLAVDIEIPNANNRQPRPVSALARLAMQPRLARSQWTNGLV
jgi:cell division topological specificity factor